MSDYSGYSTASKLEIARINKENADMAAHMATQDAQMATQKAQLESLQAMLVANGLLESSAKPFPEVLTPPPPHRYDVTQPPPGTTRPTPSRKRHSSQQLGGPTKDIRVGFQSHNRFEVLASTLSYPDKSMKPNSVASTPIAFKPTPLPIQVQAEIHHQRKSPQRTQVGRKSEIQSAGSHTRPKQLRGAFGIANEKAMRQEIEIAFVAINEEVFRGSITLQEAKHIIYKDCLGFKDFTNFDGARVGYKGGPIVIFKLKQAINVDELMPFQHFDFRRKTSRQGRTHVDVISCTIRGLRNPDYAERHADSGQSRQESDEGIREIKIEGCDYRIPENALLKVLSHYGDILSEVMEDLFDDGGEQHLDSNGTNRSGVYSVKIKLKKDIPQMVPIHGKRIKIYYKGIQKLCTNCFGPHPKTVCKSPKMPWPEYVSRFISINHQIPADLFRHRKLSEKEKTTNPTLVCDEPTVTPPNVASLPSQETEAWIDKVRHESTFNSESGIRRPNLSLPERDDDIEVDPQYEASQLILSQDSVVKLNESAYAREPTKKDFLIPESKLEHEEAIETLVQAGVRQTEAEQIISLRKTAFNKACKEFKKLPTKGMKQYQKKTKRTSKLVNQSQDNHDN